MDIKLGEILSFLVSEWQSQVIYQVSGKKRVTVQIFSQYLPLGLINLTPDLSRSQYLLITICMCLFGLSVYPNKTWNESPFFPRALLLGHGCRLNNCSHIKCVSKLPIIRAIAQCSFESPILMCWLFHFRLWGGIQRDEAGAEVFL